MTASSTAHTPPMRAAWMIGLVVIALSLAACGGVASSVAPAGEATPPPATPEATVAVPTAPGASSWPLPSPSPTGPYAYDLSDGELRAGTYTATRFRFPFKAEIDRDLGIRDAGDTERFVYIGQDKNAPVNGDEEFTAMLLDRVLQPDDQRSLQALSGDVYRWFVDHPRLRAVADSELSFEVDGDPARQIDLLPADPATCGSSHPNLDCVQIGYGPEGDEPYSIFDGSRARIVVVDHDAIPIVFAYQATDDARWASRASAFDHWVHSVDFR